MPFINPHALERKTQEVNILGLRPNNQISMILPDCNIYQRPTVNIRNFNSQHAECKFIHTLSANVRALILSSRISQ